MTNEEAFGKIVYVLLKEFPPGLVAKVAPQIYFTIIQIGKEETANEWRSNDSGNM